MFYIAGQTIGIATLFEQFLGLPYHAGVFIAPLIIFVYLGLGGQYASIVTDAVQAVLMAIIGCLVVASGIWMLGGFNYMATLDQRLATISPALVSPLNHDSPVFGDWFGVVSVMWLLFTFVLLPHLINKVLTIDSEKGLRQFVLSSGISLFFVSVTMVWAGLLGRVLIPGIEHADSIVPQYVMLAFPAPLALLIALGILSAELSTADSLFGSLATCTVNDLYKKWLSRIVHDSSSEDFHAKVEKVSNRLIRVVLFVICIGAALISLERPTSLTLLTHIGTSAILAGLIAPISFAYWSKDCSKLAAIAGFISGVGCYLALRTTIQPNSFKALLISSGLSFIAMLALKKVEKGSGVLSI